MQKWIICDTYSFSNVMFVFLNKSMEWRRKYKVDTVLQDYKSPEVLTKYFASGYTGVDKLNSYTVVVRYGMMDLKGIQLNRHY